MDDLMFRIWSHNYISVEVYNNAIHVVRCWDVNICSGAKYAPCYRNADQWKIYFKIRRASHI